MSERVMEVMRKWVLGYIEAEGEHLHWSELACDAGNYDDAFNAGRAYQSLIDDGTISHVNGTPIIVVSKERSK